MPDVVWLSLLVLKTPNLDALRSFYETLGIQFTKEQHGTGPVHYAAQVGELVLELYPGEAAQPDSTRLGFVVADLAEVLEALRRIEAPLLRPVRTTRWGVSAVVRDPDGRGVELTQRNSRSSRDG